MDDSSFLSTSLFLLIFLLSTTTTAAASTKRNVVVDDDLGQESASSCTPLLNMTICNGKCFGDCREYILPTNKCYNPQAMFPEDPSWGQYDVTDEIILGSTTTTTTTTTTSIDHPNDPVPTSLRRTIYPSTNGTCVSDGDHHPANVFTIPLNECVGPFGKPRPWGIFELLGVGCGGVDDEESSLPLDMQWK
jgi:hypothetical protein